MAVGGFEDISTEIKNLYPPGTFEEPVNKEAPYRAKLNRVDLKMVEGIAKIPLGIASAWNVSMTADVGTFNAPIDPTRVQGTVTPELFYGSFQIGVKTKMAAKSGKSTFHQGGTLADRIEKTVEDLGKYMNIVYAGTNRGAMATVAADGVNTLTLADPLRAELVKKNMRFDVTTTLTGGVIRDSLSGRKITARNRDTGIITYDGADQTAVVGDFVFMSGSAAREINTLNDIVDDGTVVATIFGQSRVTFEELNAFVFSNGGLLRNLSEQLILQMIDVPRRETGKKITRLLSNSGQARKYVEFVAPARRYPIAKGQTEPQYAIGYASESLPVVAPGVSAVLEEDFDIPPRAVFGVCWDVFGLYQAMGVDWIDDDALLKMVPTAGGHKAGFLAYVGAVENQFATMLRCNSKTTDLKDPILGDV